MPSSRRGWAEFTMAARAAHLLVTGRPAARCLTTGWLTTGVWVLAAR